MSIVLNGTTGITAPDIDVTAQTTVAAFDAGITLGGSATTLDDYEEGTWTPTHTINGFTTSTSSITGRYTKIGRIVRLQATITLSSPGYPSSYGSLTGVPFLNTVRAGGVMTTNGIAANQPGGAVRLQEAILYYYKAFDSTVGELVWTLDITYEV